MSRRGGKDCPGCGHGKNRHVGGICYGPTQLIPFHLLGRPVLLEAVGGCDCNWSYWRNDIFVGWKPPAGTKSRFGGHYRGKARRAMKAGTAGG